MNSSLAKKLFAAGSTIAMTLSAMPVLAAPHSVGQNVSSTDGTVWMVYQGTSGVCRRAYTSAGAFLSYGFNSWSQVVAANSEDLALAVCSEGFIPPQDGSVIFSDRGADKGTGYIVSGGQKFGFPTEAIFKGQGYSYATANWADMSWMAMGGVVNSSDAAHLPGTLVNNAGTVQLVGNSGLMGIPDLATFNSWGYSFAKVVPANANDKAKTQTGVMATRQAGQLSPTSVTNLPPVSGNVNVSLASTNPSAGTFINDQSQANLAEFMFSGTGTVTGLTFKRTGISADTSLSNVFLFEGMTRITDAAAVSSGSLINFTNSSGLFTVNGSKTLAVRADLAGSSGETVGVQLTAVTLSSGTVGGSLPISGNNHSIATASLADVNLTSALTISDTDPGTDITVFQGNASVTTRDVTLTRLALRQIGSIQSADIKNFRLYIDGVLVSTIAALDSNGYVTFSGLSKTLTTGTRVVKVVADVIGGSGRNVQMSLRGAYDITVVDSQYNAAPLVTATGSFPFGDSTTFSINAGTVTVVKASDSPSENVTTGGSDVSLGKWTITAYGEAVKIETLTVAVDTTGGTTSEHTLRNGRVMINGAQYGSTTSVAAVDSHASGQSFTVNFTVNPGAPATVEFRADLYDNEGTDNIAAGTVTSVQAALFGSSSSNNAIPQVSLGTLDVPSAAVTGNDVTIASGTISLTTVASYASHTTAVPQTSYKLGQWTLTGNSSEAVNINTFDVGFVDADAWDASDDLTNVFLKVGTTNTSIKGTVSDGSSTSLANSWSHAFTLAKNESVNVELWGTIASGANDGGANDTLLAYLRVTGITAVSGTSVYADTDSDTDNTDAGKAGQTITAGTGTITATKNTSLSPTARLVDDSGTVTSVVWDFAAVTDSFTITDLSFSLGSANAVSTVTVKDGTSTVASKPAATSMSFSGLSVPVAAGTTKPLSVELTMAPINNDSGTGLDLTTTMVAFTARNSGGTSAAGTESNPAGNALYAYKAVPTLTAESIGSGTLVGGVRTLAKFSISTGTTGEIAWKEIMLELTKAAGPTFTEASVALYDVTGGGNTLVNNGTYAVDFQEDTGGDDDFDAADTDTELLITIGTKADDNVEESVSGVKTYEVRATITGTIETTDYITVKLDENSDAAAEAVFTSNDNVASSANGTSFTWSDKSLNNHDTGTADWLNDDLVRNLPLNWTLNPPT